MHTRIYNPKELKGLEDLLTDAITLPSISLPFATLKFKSLTSLNKNWTQKDSIKLQCMSWAYPS